MPKITKKYLKGRIFLECEWNIPCYLEDLIFLLNSLSWNFLPLNISNDFQMNLLKWRIFKECELEYFLLLKKSNVFIEFQKNISNGRIFQEFEWNISCYLVLPIFLLYFKGILFFFLKFNKNIESQKNSWNVSGIFLAV